MLRSSTQRVVSDGEDLINEASRFRAVIRQVYNGQGVLGFWRGNGLNLLKSSPEFAIKFSVYDYTKRRLKAFRDDGHLNAIDRFVAGSMAGVVGQTFLYPLDARNSTVINHIYLDILG
ncbi:PREDICTED: calcium-binding mitochondrial carrier protein SCaMC-3-like [Diuraphis noxia]|uniref:calcium-binding mitochondrial carrier protein SCaMC-3-like n=1 Tax=Diuraphis noxia TaxID=143948 RepID=UPI00076371F2|nr:PREDICTED: calcium-binding mitochondrial carrier protein SCaMC-3-like [Diuraphis noxia]